MKKSIFNLSIISVAVFMGLLFMPTVALAAEGNIFNIISAKMITTLQDVRKIVYVIAGFGLIMFAVLAIFNKISFKHLAYIMIGLSLLAVMMPFINYFSGANLEDSEYNYGNFIAGGDASIMGSDVTDQKDCKDGICPPTVDNNIDIDDELETINDQIDFGEDEKLNVDTIGWDEDGCRLVGGKKECCQGKIKDGVCKKSFGQTMKDAISVGRDAVAAGKSAANAFEHGKAALDTFGKGMAGIAGVINGDGNIIDKLGGLASVVGSTIDGVGSNINAGLGDVGNAAGHGASAGDTARGDDKWSEGLKDSGFWEDLDDLKDDVDDIKGSGKDGANTAGDAADVGKDAENLLNRVGGWFGNN